VSAVNGDNPTLRNVGAGTCLDASEADSGNGGHLQQWTCSSGDTFQQWN
jgi:Ricin-type beta-trefoil lectin domain-like